MDARAWSKAQPTMVVLGKITVNDVKESKELWAVVQGCLARSKNYSRWSKFEENPTVALPPFPCVRRVTYYLRPSSARRDRGCCMQSGKGHVEIDKIPESAIKHLMGNDREITNNIEETHAVLTFLQLKRDSWQKNVAWSSDAAWHPDKGLLSYTFP